MITWFSPSGIPGSLVFYTKFHTLHLRRNTLCDGFKRDSKTNCYVLSGTLNPADWLTDSLTSALPLPAKTGVIITAGIMWLLDLVIKTKSQTLTSCLRNELLHLGHVTAVFESGRLSKNHSLSFMVIGWSLSAAFLAFQAPATKAGLYAMVMSCFSVHLLVYFLRTCWLDNCLTDPEVLAVTPAVSIRNAAGSVSQYLTHW